MTGITEIDGGIVTATEPKTDYQVQLPLVPATYSVGTWTVSEDSNVYFVTRTTAAAQHYYVVPIIMPARTTADKGAKLKSVKMVVTFGGTIDTAADDTEINIIKVTMPADGGAPVGSILAGDAGLDYGSTYDTKAKRLVAGTHTFTVTIPTNEQVFMNSGEQLYARFMVKDAANADLTCV